MQTVLSGEVVGLILGRTNLGYRLFPVDFGSGVLNDVIHLLYWDCSRDQVRINIA